ncbi:sigma factor [Effusibacillus lacus]|uniref:RNA polymerase sigma factor SigI n=1 Tax=Effusibacillus lacus TaxID=1348429 RepID=A0A292YNL9_9BACL|nr:sigma factor [Effusibacillus lacus]TCS70387.1 RNA polymerase sigma factor [Effusibacillus lacus]GAX91538.1 RNA polymerase sigma-I factor [Effusibacillus lacus]
MLEEPFLGDLLRKARQGDEYSRQELIQKSKDFIEKATSNICKRKVTWNEDEMSVGLIAFNEAIDRYEKSLNGNFYSYSKMIIQSRLIDYFRQEGRRQVAVSLDDVSQDEGGLEYEMNPAEIKLAWENYNEQQLIRERMEEIQIYCERLEAFGIRLEELEESSPGRVDARASLVQIAHDFIKYPHLVEYFTNTKQLPLKQMLSFVQVSRKTVERGRKYLVALIVILLSDDLPHLKASILFPDLERRVHNA